MGGGRVTGERVPLVIWREKMSVPSMNYVKETIKTELNCQASDKNSRALFQVKITQARTLSVGLSPELGVLGGTDKKEHNSPVNGN